MFGFVRDRFTLSPEKDMAEIAAISASRLSDDRDSQLDDDNSKLIASYDKVQKISEGLHRKLEEAEAQARTSEDKARRLEKEAKSSRLAELLHEEKARRLGELLEESRQIADTALEENRELVLKVADLQRWTAVVSDDEIRQTMRRLYQDLENWTKCHFRSGVLNGDDHEDSSPDDSSTTGDKRLDALHGIHGRVYGLVFQCCLAWHLVGFNEEHLDHIFRKLDEEIQAKCPTHIWYHWSSATSTAVSALAAPGLKRTRAHIIQTVEMEFGRHSGTDPAIRKKQLDNLLVRFIDFKGKLESQNDHYSFWRLVPDMPFNNKTMVSLTGECPPHGVVHSILSPLLVKSGPSRGEHTVVHKAVVKLMPELSHGGRAVDSERQQMET